MNLLWVFFGDFFFSSVLFIMCVYCVVFLIKGIIKGGRFSDIKEAVVIIGLLIFFIAILSVTGYFIYSNTADYVLKDFVENEGVVRNISMQRYRRESVRIDGRNYSYPKKFEGSQVIINKKHKFIYAKRTKKIITIVPVE